ncbi:MAG: DUF5067 domain-containing protein [Tissierellaceae bacterium]
MKKPFYIILLSILLMVGGCSHDEVRTKDDGEIYSSFLPPKTAALGEAFSVDDSNEIRIKQIKTAVNKKLETVVIITYDWTNNSNRPQTIGENVRLTVKQNDINLIPDLTPIEDVTPLVKQIQAGETLEGISQGFITRNRDRIHLFFMGKEKTIFIEGRPTKAYPVELTADFPSDT